MTKITVNGREVEADPKQPLIHACHKQGVDVPMYCYHPGLTPVGSCRICQVEVQQGDMPARVMAACRTPVAEGMVVNTEAPKAIETRRECLEFLLKNHPLDCPICDKAGECDLQDYSFAYGQDEGRTREPRRKLEKRKSLGDVIVLDEERCILCSRCVRFMEEVPKTPQLTVSNMGARSVISTFMDRPLTGNYQGNLADVCPVGALTLKPFRFQARVWNLTKNLSTCAECSRGCSTSVETLRGGEIKRFRPRPNEDVNGYWMCDTGRFAFDHVNAAERLTAPVAQGFSGLDELSFPQALALTAERLRASETTLLIASPFLTQEEAGEVLAIAKELRCEAMFVAPEPNELADDLLHTGDPCPNGRGLTELGFAPLKPTELTERCEGADRLLLVGERIGELTTEALADVRTRRIVLDAFPQEHASTELALPCPLHVEKGGHWVNVDGHRGRLTIARPAPRGVPALERTLADLASLLKPTEVAG